MFAEPKSSLIIPASAPCINSHHFDSALTFPANEANEAKVASSVSSNHPTQQSTLQSKSTLTDSHSQMITGAIAEARRVINEEARGLDRLADMVGESFARAASALLVIPGRIILTGLGKSGQIGRKIASTMASTGSPAFFLHPGDLNHGDLGAINRGDAVIILSRSGDVPELTHAILRCHRLEIFVVAITAKARSKLAEAANATLLIPDIPEACPNGMAPTTSAVCMLSIGDALAMYMMKRRNFGASDFKLNHPGGNLGRRAVTVRELLVAKNQQVPSKAAAKIPTLLRSCRLDEALPVILCSRQGIVGVVDDAGRLVDALTDRDLGVAILSHNRNEKCLADVLELLDVQRVQQSVTIANFTVQEGDQAAEAVVKMTALDLRGVFVVDESGYAVGFLTMNDCMEAGISPAAIDAK